MECTRKYTHTDTQIYNTITYIIDIYEDGNAIYIYINN